MAAGSGAASGHGGRGALEATLDRRFQGVSNTMESIQGLSTWCIENKKYHSLIVRYWMKWLKKSDTNHRLNLFYLANDVIQNCKRKNAVVFRSAFAEVLPNAALMVKDPKVRKSVERIFTIWEERNVYPEEVITQLKANLARKEREREKEKEKEKAKETPPPPAPVNPKAALKSKIVADFIPQSFIEQLAGYKRSGEEEELRETQLAGLRVDVCSTEALKRLKDKAGGNKFAKDFEEGSLKLQEFVTFLENQMTVGPPLLEALGNADVFYEMQYKEVKIVANAYKTFANRVINLKRKLDTLKSSLPGPEDSPIPSPSEDAPSPTGSDSPFLGLGEGRGGGLGFDPDLDGSAMEEGDAGVARLGDNRDVEDMELSEEDNDKTDDKPLSEPAVLKAAASKPPEKPAPVTPIRTSNDSPLMKAAPSTPIAVTLGTPKSAGVTVPSGPNTTLGVNLANVDLGKISSILSSITSAMKNTASPVSRPSPGTPTTPSGQSSLSKPPVGPTPPSPALASILSRVNVTPEGIFTVLSKTHTQGLSSLLRSGSTSSSAPTSHSSPDSSVAKGPPTPTTPIQTKPALSISLKRDTPERSRGARDWGKTRETSPPPPPPPPPPLPSSSVSPPSLESKINRFLQGNPGFSLSLGDGSPLLGGDGVDGTPVRDESGGTPTQDEIMDTPGGASSDPLGINSDHKSLGSSVGHNLSPTAYRSDPWDVVITPSGSGGGDGGDFLSSSSSRFQGYGVGKKAANMKEEDSKRKLSSSSVGSSKTKKDTQNSQGKNHGGDRSVGAERRASVGSRKASSGSEEGGMSKARDEKGKKGVEDCGGSSDGEGGQYHRIETLVSPCTEGAPIQSLGAFSNRQPTGERIQTVESIRVIGRGLRCGGGGGGGGRPGGGMWYDEDGYLEAQTPSPASQAPSDDMPLPPPHHHLPPHPNPPSHPHPHPHGPPPQFQMPPYHGESPQGHLPSHLHHHPPPFFSSPPPPMPRPPPPPMPQPPQPPRNFLPPSAVMVGGVLVPIDRQLPIPPQVHSDGGSDRGGLGGGQRGGKGGPPPLMLSLLGEPPKMPRPGTATPYLSAPKHLRFSALQLALPDSHGTPTALRPPSPSCVCPPPSPALPSSPSRFPRDLFSTSAAPLPARTSTETYPCSAGASVQALPSAGAEPGRHVESCCPQEQPGSLLLTREMWE
ncbi:hypothetical protein DPEC_G00142710 [Dallia pectoralis]|uniref:Uncharacterized protein n=1 Tax=Dallia pectoralis TaxID=75939 RepID=A0ACC2GN50_DALPE|nr:hypothetical protein DPEC_G00142710 [Dallia pectoralis]